jgi:sulfur relay protein TusB/DsrH
VEREIIGNRLGTSCKGGPESVNIHPNPIIAQVKFIKSCVLLMKVACTEGESWRIGEAIRAKGDALFLLGDAVVCGRKEFRGHASSIVSAALSRGAKVSASARDLRARGIDTSELHEGILVVEDIEGDFIDMTMMHADRVIAW